MDYHSIVTYENSQSWPQWIDLLLAVFAIGMFSLSAYLLRTGEPVWASLFILFWSGLLYLVLLNFSRLRCTVTPSSVELGWRLGWPTKAIDRGSIVAMAPRRNAWYAGWGVRKVSRGWMWNVWGLDAVELELDSGRVFRIGTDDVDGLLAALAR